MKVPYISPLSSSLFALIFAFGFSRGLISEPSHHVAPGIGNAPRSDSKGAPLTHQWQFPNCTLWLPEQDKVTTMHMSMGVWEKKSKVFKERTVNGSLSRSEGVPRKLDFNFVLGHNYDRKKHPNVWTETMRNAKRDGDRFDEESLLYEERGDEKILMLPMSKFTRPGTTSFQKFPVAMFSSYGNYVQAEVTTLGEKFNTVRILGTCGNGFGFAKESVGKLVNIPSALSEPPKHLWPIDPHGPTVTPVGREYSENQMVLLQNLLEQLGKAQP